MLLVLIERNKHFLSQVRKVRFEKKKSSQDGLETYLKAKLYFKNSPCHFPAPPFLEANTLEIIISPRIIAGAWDGRCY